jgi:hypothetical protein
MTPIKTIISDYFRTHCKRQLYFNIRQDAIPADVAKAIEENLKNNKIVQQLRKSGKKWEDEKFSELKDCFNEQVMKRQAVVDDRRKDEKERDIFEGLETYLIEKFPRYLSGTFIFEPEFELPDDFIDRMELRDNPDFTQKYTFRPDILELLPDRLPESYESKFRRYLTHDGQVLPMDENDDRQRLRVIDIKLLSEASPSYFAEVTLYSMILASWLKQNGLDSEYVVVPNAAIWSGTYNESELKRVYSKEKNATLPHALWIAMQDDLEEAPIEAFVGAIRQFFMETVPEVLKMTPEQCDDEACISYQCRSCPFLDVSPSSDLASPQSFVGCRDLTKNSGHLSRVPQMSNGTITLLRDEFNVVQTQRLSELSHERIQQSDCKNLIPNVRIAIERAKALEQAKTLSNPPPARLLEDTGTSCIMPKSPDVHVYLHTSYDFVHLITLSFGMRVVERNNTATTKIYLVEKKSIKQEADVFSRFCKDVVSVLEENTQSSIQFYFWDSKQYEHFQRLVERHHEQLLKVPQLSRIVFLMPPETLLPNPAMENWQSPRTILSDVLNPRLVAPIPYHYSLLATARCFHDPSKNETSFAMPELRDENLGNVLLFEEPLHSQIPSDQIYDLWKLTDNRDDAAKRKLLDAIHTAVTVQLTALESITLRLEIEMGHSLFSQPPRAASIRQPDSAPIATDSEIWLRFSQLDVNFFSLMEFVKTVYRKMNGEKVAIRISTTRCNPSDYISDDRDPQKRQDLMMRKARHSARSVGIDLDFIFKTEKEAFDDHARIIETDHGWNVTLDRGFDMFVFPPSNGRINESVIFNMKEETQMLKTQKTYIVVEPPV